MKETAYFGRKTRLPHLHCPACGKLIDGATGVSLEDGPARPESGSFTICLCCATLLVYEESCTSVSPLGLRRAAAGEMEALKQRNPRLAALLAKMQEAARKLVRSRKTMGQG